MPDAELLRVFTGLAALLVAAHATGRLFGRLGLPPVVGEITGGLLLGPTLLGQFAPQAHRWLFAAGHGEATALVQQLGLLLLMFTAGTQMRGAFSRDDGRTVAVIAVVGMAVPFACGLLLTGAVDERHLIGPADSPAALTLVVACAIAVTSIPVISRIMLDLGIAATGFARIVLSVAVLEDVVLNVVISVAVGLAATAGGKDPAGAAALLGIDSAAGAALYHAGASLAVFALAFAARPRTARRPATVPVTMSVLLLTAAACLFLGVAPFLGAFAVGLVTGARVPSQITGLATGFFIPVYFASVGLRLDLVHAFSPWSAAAFLTWACAAKTAGVYGAARLTGRPPRASADLAVAMNARGGPGIVLATVALDAGIIAEHFFTTLILTAVLTSLLAGWWLHHAVRRGAIPAPDEPPTPTTTPVGAPVPASARGDAPVPALARRSAPVPEALRPPAAEPPPPPGPSPGPPSGQPPGPPSGQPPARPRFRRTPTPRHLPVAVPEERSTGP
ncbi:cation:proton antiporter [Streptomyces sp. NPDC006393]|uniref:cation:proton antiporter n=1 Tax=Streptomyces sp. NPDC006393 TaxID=3156763 RepID=UPI0034118D8E